MFRLTIFSIVISFIFISVTCQPSSPEYSMEFGDDKSEEISFVDLKDGDYVVKLVVKLMDCHLEKKSYDSMKLRTYLENLYAETLNARGLPSWIPLHLSALNKSRKEKCTLQV